MSNPETNVVIANAKSKSGSKSSKKKSKIDHPAEESNVKEVAVASKQKVNTKEELQNQKKALKEQAQVLKLAKKELEDQAKQTELLKAHISSKDKAENFHNVENMVRMAYCLEQQYPFSSSSFIQVTLY